MRRLTILTILIFVCVLLSAQIRQTRMCIWNNGTCDKVWVESGIDSITFVEETIDDVLKYAYTSANNGVICEYSSDNVIDNNVPDPKTGYANDALATLSDMLNIPVIASGGAGTMTHFRDTFIAGKADAALAASVFHFGEIKIPELKQYLSEEGINVRR